VYTQIKCFDAENREYKLLVKAGNDDMRQDAVMQQFFGLINALLARNR
jgi:ataxia telangiectasia mutated family protein